MFKKLAILSLTTLLAFPAVAADTPETTLNLTPGGFSPKELTLPADTKVKLIVNNQTDAAAEFESYDLHREKIVPAKGSVSVFVGPLKPGTYSFFDEFKPGVTGTVIVK